GSFRIADCCCSGHLNYSGWVVMELGRISGRFLGTSTSKKEIVMTVANVLWASRFRAAPSRELMALSRSDASHFRLVPYDLAASVSHARELVRAGLLTQHEGETIEGALAALGTDITAGILLPSESDEDVHTFLERVLMK